MHLHLVDLNSQLVDAWQKAFAQYPEVSVEHGDLLETAEHCIVSPANSYGLMDGGIDAAYSAFFGEGIGERVHAAISGRPEGYLPVGASLAVYTGHPRIPYLIVAPTMVMPEAVESLNSYRAMRAVLRLLDAEPKLGAKVFSPGLATGVGRVSPESAASMMAEAYGDWKTRARLS